VKYTDLDGRDISWGNFFKGSESSIPLLFQTKSPDDLRKFNEFINDGNSWFLGVMGVAGIIYGAWGGLQKFVRFVAGVYLKIKEGITISFGKRWQFNMAPNFDKKGIDFNIETRPNSPPKKPDLNDLNLPKMPPGNGVPNGEAPQNEINANRPRKEEHIEM
jgi:hypothetical protein